MQKFNEMIKRSGMDQKKFMEDGLKPVILCKKFKQMFRFMLIPLSVAALGATGEDVAKASKWGFKPDDATECLQQAIKSGAKKLIIDNTGHDWIISKTILLASDQELVLSDGVTLRAKPGAFKGKFEPLLAGYNVSNVIIRGEGKAAIRMNKKDYQDTKLYQFSEWRHGIFLGGCSNVTIRDFTITETGGDGIALGTDGNAPYCRNILVDNMNLDANHRLAMGVVAVDGLILRNSKLSNTSGTSPGSGIDFEPNRPNERIANAVIENCVFENNKEHAIVLNTQNFNADSFPVSLTVRNCRGMERNVLGMHLMPTGARSRSSTPVRGNILIEDCVINNFVEVRNCIDGAFKIKFKNVTLNLPNKPDSNRASLMISCTGIPPELRIGGIEFDNFRINDTIRPPVKFNFSGSGGLADSLSGILIYNGKPFDLKPVIAEEQRKIEKLNSLKPAVQPKISDLRPPPADSTRQPEGAIPLRAATAMLQYAEAGRPVTVNVKMNRYYHSDGAVEIFNPSGKLLSKVPISCDKKEAQPVTFTPVETGIYRLVCNPGINSIMATSNARGNGFLIEKDVLTILQPNGRLYFRVPAGVKEFSLSVSGSPEVNVVLRGPDGKEVQKKLNVSSMEPFSAIRADILKDEIWSIGLSGSCWLATLRMYAPLTPIVSTNPDTLFL